MKTGLLVSVRDAHEAQEALAAGADFIDAKEPRRGALGAVDAETLRQIVETVAGRAPVSAALGELISGADAEAGALPPGLALGKFGLSGCRDQTDWPSRLARAIAALPHGAGGVAVIYADAAAASAPDPDEVIRHSREAACRAVLVDTFDKTGGGLLDHWSLEECRRVIEQVHSCQMLAVMAGSLTPETIARILPLAPDYVAVRGAACRGEREGSLDGRLVREFVEIVRRRRTELASA